MSIYQCHCGKQCATLGSLTQHKNKTHAITEPWEVCILSTKEVIKAYDFDIYVSKLKTCRQCGCEFSNQTNTFCSSACSTKFNHTGRKHSDETRKKISKSIRDYCDSNPEKLQTFVNSRKSSKITHGKYIPVDKNCPNCNVQYFGTRKSCSETCRNEIHSNRMSERLRKDSSHFPGRTKDSYMERTFKEWLATHGINKGFNGYLDEVRFRNPETKKNGFADFVFPHLKLIIELDGTHHIKRKHLDEVRDAYLETIGWAVYRITHREYLKGTKVDAVKSLLGVT